MSVNRIVKRDHHVQTGKCVTRPKYRQGRKDTAVKVFTVSQESYFLLIQNVPSLGVQPELQALCQKFGTVEKCERLSDYPSQEFTEVFLVQYSHLQEARTAKKELDERSFFGASLNVCYAPELETIAMTSRKLQERRKMVKARLYRVQYPGATKTDLKGDKGQSKHKGTVDSNGSKQLAKDMSTSSSTSQPKMVTYIWAGEEYTVPVTSETHYSQSFKKPVLGQNRNTSFKPRQLTVQKDTTEASNSSPSALSYEETRKRIRSKLDAVRTPNPGVSLRKRMKKDI